MGAAGVFGMHSRLGTARPEGQLREEARKSRRTSWILDILRLKPQILYALISMVVLCELNVLIANVEQALCENILIDGSATIGL